MLTGEWRKLHNGELNDLHSSPDIVRVVKSKIMRWVGHIARMVERRGVYRDLMWKPDERSPLGRPSRRLEDNIKMDLGFGGLEVACWPLVPKFAGSNPAEAVGFFRAIKSSARLPSEGK